MQPQSPAIPVQVRFGRISEQDLPHMQCAVTITRRLPFFAASAFCSICTCKLAHAQLYASSSPL